MCVVCYELPSGDHWADGVAESGPGRSRHRRARILSAVLAPYGLAVTDPGAGPHCVIADRKGAAEIASGLPGVWQAAQRLSSRPIDALDPALIEALESDGTAGSRP